MALGLALVVKGFYDRNQASPSPHGYIEVFYALPRVLMGILIAIGSLLTLSPWRWVRITGIGITGLGAIAALAFFSLIWWFSGVDP